jgi:hypothetical protein
MSALPNPDLPLIDEVESPPPPSRVEGARILRRIAEHELALRRVAEDAEAQMAEITEWAKSESRQHEREIAILKARLEPCVVAEIERSPLKRRSVSFPTGTAGYRTPTPKLIVEDVETAVSWCREHRPEWVRIPQPELEKTPLKRDSVECGNGMLAVPGEEPGELIPIPGVRLERSEPVFYVTTGAGGTRLT